MDILVIPDTQVKPGVPTDHIAAAGRYLVEHKPTHVVVLGDWWDMPSLSRFNSKLEGECLRVQEDLDAGSKAMLEFLTPLHDYNNKRRDNKKKLYTPKLVFLTGNHDPMVRMPRFEEDHPQLAGFFQANVEEWLTRLGFQVVPYREILDIGGIKFSHYFQNPYSAVGSPVGGMIETMIKNVGYSFVQGHKQGLKMGKLFLGDGSPRIGIVAGSFYQHEERYMGPQANHHWHGIIHLRNVENGAADIQEISLNNLVFDYAQV